MDSPKLQCNSGVQFQRSENRDKRSEIKRAEYREQGAENAARAIGGLPH